MSVEYFIRRMGYVDGKPDDQSFEVVIGAADPAAPKGCPARLEKRVEKDKKTGKEIRTHFEGGTSETFYFASEAAATREAIKAVMDHKADPKAQSAREKLAKWCADHCKEPKAKDMTPQKEADLRLV